MKNTCIHSFASSTTAEFYRLGVEAGLQYVPRPMDAPIRVTVVEELDRRGVLWHAVYVQEGELWWNEKDGSTAHFLPIDKKT